MDRFESSFRFIEDELKKKPVASSPFPHFYLKSVFPTDFYDCLVGNLPTDDHYNWKQEVKSLEDYRGRFHFSKREILGLDDAKRYYWNTLYSKMLSLNFLSLIINKFQKDLRLRFEESLDQPLFAELKLLRDRKNYALKVHTDVPHRVVSVLFYLPRDAYIAQNGTSIYVPKEVGFTCGGTTRHDYDQFDLHKTVPFEPNNGLCFIRTNNSFHGVAPFESDTSVRDILIINIWEKTFESQFQKRMMMKAKEKIGAEPVRRQFTLRQVIN